MKKINYINKIFLRIFIHPEVTWKVSLSKINCTIRKIAKAPDLQAAL